MWEFRDAWLLQAIIYAAGWGEADLPTVMFHADGINVDIPTREDLERCVNNLAAAGLVTADGMTFRATKDGRRLVRKAGRLQAGIRDVPPRVLERLRRSPFPDEPARWSLSPSEWQTAYDEYSRWSLGPHLPRERQTDGPPDPQQQLLRRKGRLALARIALVVAACLALLVVLDAPFLVWVGAVLTIGAIALPLAMNTDPDDWFDDGLEWGFMLTWPFFVVGLMVLIPSTLIWLL